MTNPAATVPLTYDNTDVQLADFQIFLQIVSGLNESPTVRGKNVTVPGRAGTSHRAKVNATLPIELRGVVRADPALTDVTDAKASFRDNQRIVRELFDLRERRELAAELENGDVVTIQAEPQNLLWNEFATGFGAEVSIVLEGNDDWLIT